MEAPHSPAADTAAAFATRLTIDSPDHMQELGRRLAVLLRPGDLVMLSGELGAGKTTLTRGLGEGLGVRGAVTSPTFVIARVHPPLGDGPRWCTWTRTAWAVGSTRWRTSIWTSRCPTR